jgi:hypothetical protein
VEEEGVTRLAERRAAGVVAIGAALLIAAALVALAIDVVRWDREVERADVHFSGGAAARADWRPDTFLPAGVSRVALGLEDDLAVRDAVRRFRLSRPRQPLRSVLDVAARSAAEAEIARALRKGAGPRERALLANLRGVLALEEARIGREQASVLVRRAAASFREAIGIDPAYEDAKFNLELAYMLLRQSGRESGGGGGERVETPASGAGAASAGSGY